jgi:hypothetical protein
MRALPRAERVMKRLIAVFWALNRRNPMRLGAP